MAPASSSSARPSAAATASRATCARTAGPPWPSMGTRASRSATGCSGCVAPGHPLQMVLSTGRHTPPRLQHDRGYCAQAVQCGMQLQQQGPSRLVRRSSSQGKTPSCWRPMWPRVAWVRPGPLSVHTLPCVTSKACSTRPQPRHALSCVCEAALAYAWSPVSAATRSSRPAPPPASAGAAHSAAARPHGRPQLLLRSASSRTQRHAAEALCAAELRLLLCAAG